MMLNTRTSLACLLAIAGCATDDTTDDPDLVADGDGKGDGDGVCSDLPKGPFTPVSLGQPFMGSEDFTLDGHDGMVGRRGDKIVRANGDGQVTTTLATVSGDIFGLRFHPDGSLVGAMVHAGKIVSVAPDGEVTDLVTGLNGPNGIFVDLDSNIYFTEGGANRVTLLFPDGGRRTMVSGADKAEGANGVIFDPVKMRVYYTEYNKGKIHRISTREGFQSPVEVTTIPGAGVDGLVLDECHNIYVIDQRNSKLYRVGPGGGAAKLLATFPVNVSNAQFGSGDSFDAKTLFVVGSPGTVFAVPVGVSGMPVPSAP